MDITVRIQFQNVCVCVFVHVHACVFVCVLKRWGGFAAAAGCNEDGRTNANSSALCLPPRLLLGSLQSILKRV